MFVSQKAPNGRHIATEFFLKEKWRRLAEEWALTAYGVYLTPITSFKYLRLVLTAEEDDQKMVIRNLRRAIQKWLRMNRILSREGADARNSG